MKIYNYVVILLGLMVLMDFSGIIAYEAGATATGITTLVGFQRNADNSLQFDPSFSTWFNSLFETVTDLGLGTLIAIGAAGLAIGTFAKGKLENFILLPIITTTLVYFISSIKDVVAISIAGGDMPTWIGYIVVFIGIILVGGLFVSLWEHFRGTD